MDADILHLIPDNKSVDKLIRRHTFYEWCHASIDNTYSYMAILRLKYDILDITIFRVVHLLLEIDRFDKIKRYCNYSADSYLFKVRQR